MIIVRFSLLILILSFSAFAMEAPVAQPPANMPATQSAFYMPLISAAYYAAKRTSSSDSNAANEIALRPSVEMVKTLIGEHADEIVRDMITAITVYLTRSDNLQKLEQAYSDDRVPVLGAGHVRGAYQVEILMSARLSQATKDLINNHTVAGMQISDDIKFAYDDVEAYMSHFIRTYYHYDFAPMNWIIGDVNLGWESYHLAGQLVRCADSNGLTQVKLNRIDGLFRYDFTCTAGLRDHELTRHATPWNYDGGGRVFYFDRHDVACGEYDILNGFELVREVVGGEFTGNMRFEYSCRYANLRDVTTHYTEFSPDDRGDIASLERHDLRCPEGKLLNGFKMERIKDEEARQYRFIYKCGSNLY